MVLTGQIPTKNVKFEGGEWWYTANGDGFRRRLSSVLRKQHSRMFVGGEYISNSHPLHKAGRFKSWSEVYSGRELNAVRSGDVYAIINRAWPAWVKIGMAVDAGDRLNSYQTSDPHRSYTLVAKGYFEDRRDAEAKVHSLAEIYAEERRGEWFKLSPSTAAELIQGME